MNGATVLMNGATVLMNDTTVLISGAAVLMYDAPRCFYCWSPVVLELTQRELRSSYGSFSGLLGPCPREKRSTQLAIATYWN